MLNPSHQMSSLSQVIRVASTVSVPALPLTEDTRVPVRHTPLLELLSPELAKERVVVLRGTTGESRGHPADPRSWWGGTASCAPCLAEPGPALNVPRCPAFPSPSVQPASGSGSPEDENERCTRCLPRGLLQPVRTPCCPVLLMLPPATLPLLHVHKPTRGAPKFLHHPICCHSPRPLGKLGWPWCRGWAEAQLLPSTFLLCQKTPLA